MPDQMVTPSESVSRFLFNGQIRAKDNAVRYEAFLPSESNLTISIFRVSNLSEAEIWAIAVEKVEPYRGKGPAIGRGNLSIAQIMENRLKVMPDTDPTSRHANIVEWPDDRDHRKAIAMDLAAHASPAKKRETH